MTEPRRIMPLPLGGEHGLPYSRGLMARALMAVGVAPDRAYGLARKVGDDLAARGSDVVELDRLESTAIESLGEVEGGRSASAPASSGVRSGRWVRAGGARRCGTPAATRSSVSSTCRS